MPLPNRFRWEDGTNSAVFLIFRLDAGVKTLAVEFGTLDELLGVVFFLGVPLRFWVRLVLALLSLAREL